MGIPASLLIALTSANPRIAREIVELGQRRQDDNRLRMRLAELHVHRDIIRKLANGKVLIDGAFDKLYCRLHDAEFPLRLLPPYESFGEAEYQQYHFSLARFLPDYLRV